MLKKKSSIKILKDKLSNTNIETYSFGQKNCKIVTFLNCYSYLFFRKQAHLYQDIDVINCDGIILQKLVSLLGVDVQRKSFDMTSLAPIVFDVAEQKGYTLAIVGSEDNSLANSINIIKNKYPKLKIIEQRNGFFSSLEEREVYINNLCKLSPDIVIVGMGTPLQDIFLIDLKKSGWQGLGYTCGGFLHQTASKGIKYYPEFINKFNLRWLYRIYDEPKLFKRYALLYPVSILFFLFDLISHKFYSN